MTQEKKVVDRKRVESTYDPEEVCKDNNSIISDEESTDDVTDGLENQNQNLNNIVKRIITKNQKNYPEKVEIIDTVDGDIGNDGIRDIVSVLQYKVITDECNEYEHYSRIMIRRY